MNQQNQFKELTLENLAGGAAVEVFQRELGVVAKNISDLNTDPKKSRKIVLTVTLTPEENRQEVKMSVSAKSTLASVKPASKTVFLGKVNGKPTLIGNDPQQTSFEFSEPGVTPLKPSVGAQ